MKIIQVIDQLKVGGAERVLVNLANILDNNKQDVSVLCLLQETVLDKELHSSIPLYYLSRKNKFNPITLFKLYRLLQNYDIVHVHCRHVLRYVGLLLFLPVKLRKFELIFHDHFGRIDSEQEIDFLLKKQLRKVSSYICVSQTLADWCTQMFPNKTTNLLRNIVRSNTISYNEKDDEETIDLIMVGNFRPQKNYEFALRLLAVLQKKYHLTIIGKRVDEAYYKRLLGLMDSLKIVSQITVIDNCNNSLEYIINSDLAIHTANSETGPLVAIEYLSVGLPFLMYNTGEVSRQIKPELSDFIMTDMNIDNWTSRIAYILANKATYSSKINSTFHKNYSEENYYNECLKIYQNIINS